MGIGLRQNVVPHYFKPPAVRKGPVQYNWHCFADLLSTTEKKPPLSAIRGGLFRKCEFVRCLKLVHLPSA
jgi:hypothetical protein